jgi:hypothetical protein
MDSDVEERLLAAIAHTSNLTHAHAVALLPQPPAADDVHGRPHPGGVVVVDGAAAERAGAPERVPTAAAAVAVAAALQRPFQLAAPALEPAPVAAAPPSATLELDQVLSVRVRALAHVHAQVCPPLTPPRCVRARFGTATLSRRHRRASTVAARAT